MSKIGNFTHETPESLRRWANWTTLDLAILRYLERNGRATNYEVGEAVGLSASAASRRIQALEEHRAPSAATAP